MAAKVKRIFFKYLGIVLLFLFLTALTLFFAVQTYTFQTWLGKISSTYLSNELQSTIRMKAVKIDFFKKAELTGVLILDQHQDTILSGDLTVNIQDLDYLNSRLILHSISISHATAKIIKYRGDTVFNYNHLVNYFDSGSKDSTGSDWFVKLNGFDLNDVAFVYRNEKYVTKVGSTINFDNVWLKHTSGSIRELKIDSATKTLIANIHNLQTQEQSGFTIKDLDTRIQVSNQHLRAENFRLQTNHSLIIGLIDFKYQAWSDYTDFVDKVYMDSELYDSTLICFTDIASFTDELVGLDETLLLSGKVKGTVNEMNIRQVNLNYKTNTRFRGNISMSGITDFMTSYIHFDADELSSNYSDLQNIPTYPFHEGNKIKIPQNLKSLGTVSYKGKFDGFTNDFTTYGKFKTALGQVNSQLSIKLGETYNDISYNGNLKTDNFYLGTLFGLNDFDQLSVDLKLKGKGIELKHLNAEFEGKVNSIRFHGYQYKNAGLNGKIKDKLFTGVFESNDEHANFDFNGTIDFSNKIPEMNFISTINRIDFDKIHFKFLADTGSFSSQVFINIKGDDINNLSGRINFDNSIYKTTNKTYKLSSLDILLEQFSAEKKIRLSSEYLNAAIYGHFDLSNLNPAINSMLHQYYPSYFEKPSSKTSYQDEITAQIKIKKFQTIKDLVLPDLMVSKGSILDMNFDASLNKLNFQLVSDRIDYLGMNMKDLSFILNENDSVVLAELSGKSFHLTDSLAMQNFNFRLNSIDKKSIYQIDWDNLQSISNKGELKGQITFNENKLQVFTEKINITINDSTWNLEAPNTIRVEKNGSIFVEPMLITNHSQSVLIKGALTETVGDSLTITTNSVILKQFNPLLKDANLKLSGLLNGDVMLSNVHNKFAFNGDIRVDNFVLNDNIIGQALVKALYYPSDDRVALSGFTSLGLDDEFGQPTKNISFRGNYYLNKKEESLDIDFSAKPANLKLLNPFIEGILTVNYGFVNGAGKIHGTPQKILIDGKFRIFNSEIKVDYTNVVYNITGDIEVMPDQIRFSDLYMREKGTRAAAQGTINGNIFHRNFSDIQLDYDITYKNMLILNTTQVQNPSYYGRVFGTGNVGIYGHVSKLNMVIDNTTNKNSKFYLPLDSPTELSENSFVQFVKKDTSALKIEPEISGFNLDITMHATPDLNVQIIIDEQTGDILNVKGNGDLGLSVNMLGKFEMEGDYVISNGDYLFTIENVINKKFEIEPGSVISWNGNPTGAEIDVTTSYKQRASVAPLLNDTTGLYKQPTAVDCNLQIEGKLFSPIINFDINFPNIDATARARIQSVLSDETELNRQVFSFLLFRTFVTPTIYNANSGGVSAGGAAMSTGSELLSNRVSDFLNNYLGGSGLKDLQLSVNYKPQTTTSNETMNVGLSKQFFDNRMTVDGNFGMTNASTSANPNGIIGDLYVDYKLSADGRFRIKGFNKSNDITQMALAGGPYTQGVGFFYRVEFETLASLYDSYVNRIKRIEMIQKRIEKKNSESGTNSSTKP